jgi:hypothetical protein
MRGAPCLTSVGSMSRHPVFALASEPVFALASELASSPSTVPNGGATVAAGRELLPPLPPAAAESPRRCTSCNLSADVGGGAALRHVHRGGRAACWSRRRRSITPRLPSTVARAGYMAVCYRAGRPSAPMSIILRLLSLVADDNVEQGAKYTSISASEFSRSGKRLLSSRCRRSDAAAWPDGGRDGGCGALTVYVGTLSSTTFRARHPPPAPSPAMCG